MEKPLLRFENGRWQGEDDTIQVSMSNETFFAFVEAYLDVQGIKNPTQRQKEYVINRCRAVFYWHHRADARVKLTKKKVTHVSVT